VGGRNSNNLSEGSEVFPYRPSDRSNLRVAKNIWGFNFDGFKLGVLHEKHAEATCFYLGNHVTICLKTEESQENLCRHSQSQDLPDTEFKKQSGNKR
jgi:hypothetical protein